MHHAIISILFGVFLLALYGWMWTAPGSFRNAMMAFPRNLPAGVVLVSISLAWFGYNISFVDFGPFSIAKKALYGALPCFAWLAWRYIPDLLAVRGLAYLVLLAGNPILVQVRWHGTAAHYAVATLVYLIMVKAAFLIIYPQLWKRGVVWMSASAGRTRRLAGIGLGVGGALVLAGVVSF